MIVLDIMLNVFVITTLLTGTVFLGVMAWVLWKEGRK